MGNPNSERYNIELPSMTPCGCETAYSLTISPLGGFGAIVCHEPGCSLHAPYTWCNAVYGSTAGIEGSDDRYGPSSEDHAGELVRLARQWVEVQARRAALVAK